MQKAVGLKARQIKAARALIDWSQEELADAAGLSVATVRNLELGNISPRGNTNYLIRRTLEDSGLEFLEPDGVRHRPEDITIYQGVEGLKAFFDDVYIVGRQKGGEFYCVCESEAPYLTWDKKYAEPHIERMTRIKDKVSVKNIITGSNIEVFCGSYCEYRTLSKHYVNSVPFYVYDDKYAFFVFEAEPSPKIIVTRSSIVANAFKKQFVSMWEKATPLDSNEMMRNKTKKT